jgi:DNA invertase Pin-like site-specific DNA recombinase
MICAIYARKSTEQNGVADEAKSVTRQIEHARTYAAKKGWRFVVAEALHAAHGDIDTEYRKLGVNLLQELEALRKKGG